MPPTSDYALSIVLPTYEERENIIVLLDQLHAVLSIPFEAIVVDDNSPDLTWQVVSDYSKTHPNVKLLHRIHERGLTTAIDAGIRMATAPLVMWMDVDLSMPPDRIPALLAAIDAGADVAVGSRYVPGGGDARAVSLHLSIQLALSKFLSVMGGWMLGCKFRDWSSGFIVMRRDLLNDYKLSGDYGEYFIHLIYTMIRRKGAKVVEIPYVLTARERGESKTATNIWGLVVRGRKYLTTVWQLRVRGF